MRPRPPACSGRRPSRGRRSAVHARGDARSGAGGVPQNLADAARWYRRAAEQDDVTAQLNLGVLRVGRGVAQDHAEAVAWYRRAADQGEARAQANLGHAYANGRGVAQDYAQAAAWYRRAADQGHAASQSTWESYTRARAACSAVTWKRAAGS